MTGRNLKFLACTILLTALFIYPNNIEAAVCAFRNPDRDLYVLFPDATGYRTIFKELNEGNRDEIEAAAGQPLDISDIGTHTLYVVLKGEEPIGFIHVHAEWGSYGTVECVFAYNLDGSIKDFLIQRSRERNMKQVQSEDFRKQLRGKKPGDPLIRGNSKEINTDFITPPVGAEKEASVVVFCAKKIFIFNKYIFGSVIEDVRKGKFAPKN